MRKTRMQRHRATYNENGDIVLLTEERPAAVSVQEEVVVEAPAKKARNGLITKAASTILTEGQKQLQASVEETMILPTELKGEFRSGLKSMWKVLQQPVWVPGRKGKPKKYARGTLFLMDTFRFGATFATIFGGLFLSLNYQSFLTIVQASLDPLAAASAGEVLETELEGPQGPSQIAAITKNTDSRSLLAMLPPVGPPENRLVIPSLNLNVPITIPSHDALLREDWKQLEVDIQAALENGVVHYPGTARPGQAGNFFVTGHSSYYPWAEGDYKSVFARLGELKVGDEYWVYYGGDKHRYRIDSEKEVSPNNVDVLDQPTDQRRATLMTCTPVGTALRRLILTAQEVSIETGEPIAVGEHEKRTDIKRTQMEQLPI